VTLYVGTSGWQYGHWLGRFYPRPRVHDDLAFYAERFRTVELNASFYRLPEAATFESWASRTPGDFVFAVKASRYLTHILRLRDPGDAVDTLVRRASRLGAKLGPVLLQLPPGFAVDLPRLEGTLEAFGDRARVAVEFRDDSWFVEGVRRLLERYNAALCIADRRSRLVTPVWRTADWGYVRMHEGRAQPVPCYGRDALMSRARMIDELFGDQRDVFVYFNNDTRGCAIEDARTFACIAGGAGLHPTRVPEEAVSTRAAV
jgi:uncharacterized protein YecE (DUF72 family)